MSGSSLAPKTSWGHAGVPDKMAHPRLPNRPDETGVWVIVLGIFASLWLGTEFVAYRFNFSPALGQPLFGIHGLYLPIEGLWWALRWERPEWGRTLNEIFGGMWMIIFYGTLVSVGYAIATSRKRFKQKLGGGDVHGSAHWATPEEIRRSGLIDDGSASARNRNDKRSGKAIFLGTWTDPKTKKTHYLKHSGPEHVMLYAPTRSGKGISVIIPTLLSWGGSVLVNDIKGENYKITSGWRHRELGSRVMKFEPMSTDGTSVHYNPLDEVRVGTDYEIQDVQQIVQIIADPDGKAATGNEAHWVITGSSLLVGAILHVLYMSKQHMGPPATLRGVAELLTDPNYPDMRALFSYLMTADHDPEMTRNWIDQFGNPTTTHPVVAASAKDMLNKADAERSGVLSTAMRFLTLYRDPIVAANIADSDFKIIDLVSGDRPVSLYIVIPPSDIARLKPLVRMMVNQVVRGLTSKLEFGEDRDGQSSNRHKLLLCLDEFPALGKLETVASALSYCAGYGIRALVVCQDTIQLHEAYGREESITSNCHVRVAFAPNRVETAKALSDMIGVTTIHVKEKGHGKGAKDSTRDLSRPLLTADEMMRLPGPGKDDDGRVISPGATIVFLSGMSPIFAAQGPFFLDAEFSRRANHKLPPSPKRVARKPNRRFADEDLEGIDADESVDGTPRAGQNRNMSEYLGDTELEALLSEYKGLGQEGGQPAEQVGAADRAATSSPEIAESSDGQSGGLDFADALKPNQTGARDEDALTVPETPHPATTDWADVTGYGDMDDEFPV